MFTKDTIAFLTELKANNTRAWFQSHKARYDTALRLPTKAFSAVLEAELSKRYGVAASAKIFRINRDLRFSHDKTPYNTHLHMSFADPAFGAAWMIGVEIDQLVIGYGVFVFEKNRLARWRDAVAGPEGAALDAALSGLRGQGARMSDPELKRVPAPFEKDHTHAELLRRKGIAVWQDLPVDNAFGYDAPERLCKRLAEFEPLRSWMGTHLS